MLLTVATPTSEEFQTPPLPVVDKVIFAPEQSVPVPVIVPAFGSALMVTGNNAELLPQRLVAVKLIVVMPDVTPVTIPVPDTVEIPIAADDQVPVKVVSANAVESPEHIDAEPEIGPTTGNPFKVTTVESDEDPQLLVTVYMIVSVPVAIAVNTPGTGKAALTLVTVHVPPGTDDE